MIEKQPPDDCAGFKPFYDLMIKKGYMTYNKADDIYVVTDIRGINKFMFG